MKNNTAKQEKTGTSKKTKIVREPFKGDY